MIMKPVQIVLQHSCGTRPWLYLYYHFLKNQNKKNKIK